jgi:hypothetical protein
MEQLARDLARAEEQISRLVIAQEEVARVLEEPVSHAGLPEWQDGQAGEPEAAAGRGSPIGRVAVPPWRADLEASALPQAYQDVLEVVADAGRPVRAAQIAAAAGLSTDRAGVEGLRSKLKRLAGRALLPRFEGANHHEPHRKKNPYGSVCPGSGCWPLRRLGGHVHGAGR